MAFGLATSHYCESTPNPRQATAASWVQDDDDEPRAHNNRHARMTKSWPQTRSDWSKQTAVHSWHPPSVSELFKLVSFAVLPILGRMLVVFLFLRLDELATEDCVTWLNDGFAQTA